MACASLVYDTAPSNSFAGMALCAQILLLAERFWFAHKSRFLFAHKVFCLRTNHIAHKSCFWQSVFCFSVSDDSVPSWVFFNLAGAEEPAPKSRDGELRGSKSERERAGARWRGALMMAARRKEWQLPSALAPSCACSLLLSLPALCCSLLPSALAPSSSSSLSSPTTCHPSWSLLSLCLVSLKLLSINTPSILVDILTDRQIPKDRQMDGCWCRAGACATSQTSSLPHQTSAWQLLVGGLMWVWESGTGASCAQTDCEER